jgi:predicted dehydrogenase
VAGKDGKTEDYGVGALSSDRSIAAPDLDFRPARTAGYNPGIAVVGCGGISEFHLKAYRAAGYRVVALVDRHPEKLAARRDAFFPDATVHEDYREILGMEDVEVVDITTYPASRAELYRPVVDAGKHILAQKPFVTDVAFGREIAEYARHRGVLLAVNQNGRWAPHFRYITLAVKAGLIGDVVAVHMGVSWDHSWIAGSSFEDIESLILYDFGIHWFDMITVLMGERRPRSVFAGRAPAPGQVVRPPMLSQCIVGYDEGQASVTFDAASTVGQLDRTVVVGTRGMLTSTGPDLLHQTVTMHTTEGVATPELESDWFSAGFHGTMAELLCAIEEGREPSHNAHENLRSLELCFSAVQSAVEGRPTVPGEDGMRLIESRGRGRAGGSEK